jgi:ADP-heptose:LPS heptosyltransferase
VHLSRRHSSLHEAQLNLKLLVPLGAKRTFSFEEISNLYGLTRIPHLPDRLSDLLDPDRFNLILHPGSKGSAREWGLDNFARLIHMLPAEKYKIFITGTQQEAENMGSEFFAVQPSPVNLCGQLSLNELIGFIANTDGMVAASTGPLHIAAATGRTVIGIYPPIKPMHPGRWAPIGPCAYPLSANHSCNRCRKGGTCTCMQEITPEMVRQKLAEIFG